MFPIIVSHIAEKEKTFLLVNILFCVFSLSAFLFCVKIEQEFSYNSARKPYPPKKRSKIQRGDSMNGNVRRNTKTAFVCVLFIIIVSLFFYLLTAGTMPESVDIPSTDKIADVDLSKQGVGIDISSGEYYIGRLYMCA